MIVDGLPAPPALQRKLGKNSKVLSEITMATTVAVSLYTQLMYVQDSELETADLLCIY